MDARHHKKIFRGHILQPLLGSLREWRTRLCLLSQNLKNA